MSDRFIEARLDKLIRQILHHHVGEMVTRDLMDRIEIEVFTKCGWAVPITVVIADDDNPHLPEPYICWETPDGRKNHIRFQDLL